MSSVKHGRTRHRSPTTTQAAKLTADDGAGGDQFGSQVDENNRDTFDGKKYDYFGISVAISDDAIWRNSPPTTDVCDTSTKVLLPSFRHRSSRRRRVGLRKWRNSPPTFWRVRIIGIPLTPAISVGIAVVGANGDDDKGSVAPAIVILFMRGIRSRIEGSDDRKFSKRTSNV